MSDTIKYENDDKILVGVLLWGVALIAFILAPYVISGFLIRSNMKLNQRVSVLEQKVADVTAKCSNNAETITDIGNKFDEIRNCKMPAWLREMKMIWDGAGTTSETEKQK